MAKYLDENGLSTLWGLIKALHKRFSTTEDGEVPAPGASNTDKFLKGDGTWATPENTTYPTATDNRDGIMTQTDHQALSNAVNKLSTIDENADVNQNAFSNVKVGSSTISAENETDTVNITAGSNITLTPNSETKTVTIASSYNNATPSEAGLMSADDKTNLDNAVSKLSGIANGAEVNQNAFSTVKVGTTSLSADTKTDTLTITAGNHITLTPTASSDSFSIAASFADATQTASGLMSSDDKTNLDNAVSKLSGIANGAEVNQNAFGKIIVDDNSTTVDADAKVDTLTFISGANVTLTPNATDGSITIAATNTTYTPASASPKMDGTAAVGTSAKYAREDHVHPTDTSRAPTSHASTATTYGKGTGTNYGHVKLSDATDSTTAAAAGGTAATPKAVSDALAAAKSYADSLDTGVSDVTVDGTSVVTNGVANVVLSGKVDKISGKGLSTNDFTDTYKTTIDNLDNTYAKKSDIPDISGVYKYKGTKATQSELPSDPVTGDVWNIEAVSDYGAAGMNVAWNGSAWDALGGLFTIQSLETKDIQGICK